MRAAAMGALLLAALLCAATTPARAFYLPGVAPQDFARVRPHHPATHDTRTRRVSPPNKRRHRTRFRPRRPRRGNRRPDPRFAPPDTRPPIATFRTTS
jgi:hypothetical protein